MRAMKFPTEKLVSVFLSRLNFAPAIGGWGQDRPGGGLGVPGTRAGCVSHFSLLCLPTEKRARRSYSVESTYLATCALPALPAKVSLLPGWFLPI